MTKLATRAAISVHKVVDDLEMGVLTDGRSYLTGRTLARMCGVVPSAIIGQATNWNGGKRDGRLAQMLTEAGVDTLYEVVDFPGSPEGFAHAYTEQVCMLFMEYYAFETREPNRQAQQNYRTLARAGLRAFVYTALGYDPANAVPAKWRQFHDRMLLASAPAGYFSVFREIADFIIGAIRGGLPVDEHTAPDISVGRAWSTYWDEAALSKVHSERLKHDHNYPEYFPQAASNPQPIWVYPVSALGEFRVWLQREYVPKKFPAYLDAKVVKGTLPAATAQVLAAQMLPAGDDDESSN